MKINNFAVLGLSFFADATVTDPSAPGSSTTTAASDVVVYDIELENCAFTPATDGIDIGDIACSFTASGGVGHYVASAILANDCTSPLALTGVVQDANPAFTATLEGDSTTQQSSNYDVIISLANSAVQSGDIAFCLLTNVYDTNGNSYDSIGQRVVLPIQMDGSFNFGSASLTTETFGGITENAEQAGAANFQVTANRCDIEGNAVTEDTVLSFGENFFLCVEGIQSSVRISSIKYLEARKSGVDTINLITSDSAGSEGATNPNTFVYGKNSNKVVIATRLPSRFFEADGGITLAGTANIGTGGSRRLARLMQETSTSEEASDFSMDIPIVASPMFKTAGGSTKGPVGVFLLAVAAAVALFV